MPLRFALVAGEASGDILGAALIRGLRARYPDATFYGVAGPRMREAGCEAIESIEALSLMGLVEVLKHLPRLLKLRRDLVNRFLQDKPDAFIGIDAPDFNLRVERDLRDRGIKTVHVNSPTIWAWRPGRIHGIAKAVDLMLCLYPFEPALYEKVGMRAACIGHPLADQLDDTVAPAKARRELGLAEAGPKNGQVVAVLPGSRGSELKYLSEPFAAAAAWLHQRIPGLRFVVPVARPDLKPVFERAIARHPGPSWHLLEGQSREAMQAADAVLLASGTAALECLLLGRPMVVAYRASAVTEFLAWKLIKIPHVSLPNILSNAAANAAVVPELMGYQATPERLGQEVSQLLRHPVLRQAQVERFASVHRELRRDAGALAAGAIQSLLGR